MNAKHIQEILGVSERFAYEYMERPDFPLVRIGRNKRVQRDKFFKWIESLENQAKEHNHERITRKHQTPLHRPSERGARRGSTAHADRQHVLPQL